MVESPRRARWLLESALPADIREAVSGDLEEVFRRRCESDGEGPARRWYWRETASFSSRFLMERLRDTAGGLMGTRMSWLDFKLAIRMLVKYPGLTLVGGLATAVAIAICAAFFEFTHDLASPTLPLDEGERVVAIQNWNLATNAPEHRPLHDFVVWRDELKSLVDIGAYDTVERNLVTEDGRSEPVKIAEMSAAGFRVARVPPLLGRSLIETDEQDGAPLVAVVGYSVWQARFGGDPDIIGQTVRLGRSPHTIVGVMPDGFSFPTSHRFWLPLRAQVAGTDRLQGPSLRVFARLAPGVTLDTAQTELTVIGMRAATDFPATNGQLRPRIVPYTSTFVDTALAWRLYGFQSFLVLILIVCCANVATLVFARTATRETEIAVRSALGASRGRLVAQLFVEALALSSLAAIVGLVLADVALTRVMELAFSYSGNDRPFWWNDTFSPVTLIYAGGLTVLCAVISGVIPALKGTRRSVQTGLQQISARGSSLRFGGVWTAVIVTQVALSVAFLPTAIGQGWQAVRAQAGGSGFAADHYLCARLEIDEETNASTDAEKATSAARLGATYQELARRLAAEPGVVGVTFANALPGMDHSRRRVELDEVAPSTVAASNVRTASVGLDFFDALRTPMLSGRGFRSGDLSPDRHVVIVNQSFVEQILGGRNAIGRRVRFADTARSEGSASGVPREPAPWHEIVGVVADLGMNALEPAEGAGLYHPMRLGQINPVRVAVRVGGDPASFASRLRTIAFAVDPTVRLYDLLRLDEVGRTEQTGYRVFASVLALVASIAVLLSTVGIYSLMSFTVSQRTREIGIRVALGARPRRIVAALFSRALAQIGLGALVGVAIVVAAGTESASNMGLLVAVAVVMMMVGLFACGVPALRALRIQPTEALKDAG